MRCRSKAAIAVFTTLLSSGCAAAAAGRPDGSASLEITQRYLEPLCLDGTAIDGAQRTWHLSPGAHDMRVTMRNAPRQGMGGSGAVPGEATIRFSLRAGDRYEVEVRAPSMSFSLRVWSRGEWKPVVRDRTSGDIVSRDPTWGAGRCGTSAPRPPRTGDGR